MDLAKLKAKAAFYNTYVNELEKQNEEPFNNRDIIDTVRDEHIIKSDLGFSEKEANAILRLMLLGIGVINDGDYSLSNSDTIEPDIEELIARGSDCSSYFCFNDCSTDELVQKIKENINDK